MIKRLIYDYLDKANNETATVSEESLDEFAAACRLAMKRRFSPYEGEHSKYSMSGIGRPLCQQHFSIKGEERQKPEGGFALKMLMGDMVEAAVMTIMKEAGVNIQSHDELITTEVSGETIRGALDVIIDDKVWDIKTASSYAFSNKFGDDGFQNMVKDDPFGYIPQGYLYGEAVGLPFGGWIAIDKTTGEINVCETPIADRSYKKAALNLVENNVAYLKDNVDKPVKKCYEAVKETFRKVATGNTVLPMTCSYCPYKKACWEDVGGVRNLPQPASKAANPKHFWYVGALSSEM